MLSQQLKTTDEAFNSALDEIFRTIEIIPSDINTYGSVSFMTHELNKDLFIECFRLKQESVRLFGEAFQEPLRKKWPQHEFTFFDCSLNRADESGMFNLWFEGKHYSMALESEYKIDSYNFNIFIKKGHVYNQNKKGYCTVS